MKTIKNKRVNRYIGEDNRFEIIDILGQGGMGEVFKAYDSKLHELVAIKSINKKFNNNRAVIDIFLNEAKTSLKITHPNVIRVRDILFFEGSHYLIMQFVDGIDLKEWMRLHKDIKDRDAKKMYEFIRPVFEALDYAHQYTVHRDIKPANIMLDNENIYLMDFGIATVTKGSKITDVIKDSHKVVGT
ncbi:MAG TPA: serine/threonine protein kinase, partial [Campylobacterales bacterium]|nr:serine/threonine protein kinase [Campylobacterales bacterium]